MKKTSTADQPGVSGSRQQLADPMEARLRALHELIPDAIDFPDLPGPYISFVRSLRERVHPVGTPEVRVVETRSGLKFNVDLGDRLGCDFYYGYCGEAFESELFMRMVCPGAVILDVGANFGFYALNAAVRAGKGGVVHAFEPAPAACQLLCDNVAANSLDNVHIHQVCVGAEDGETDFYVMEESAFSGITPTGRSRLREKITVPLRRLDSIASELGLTAVDALKIDVEGHEFAVLRGARQIIDRSPGLLIQLEVCSKNLDDEKRDALETVLTELYSQGFRGWHIDPGIDGIVELRDADEAIRQSAGNVFLVRSGSDTEQRFQDVCKALRADAFRNFATRSGLAAEPLLTRNPADPHSGLRLHAALLDSVLRLQEREVSKWKARFTHTEEDSKQRLDLLRRLEGEVAQWKERYDLAQTENAARLELIRKLEGQLAEYKARCAEADQWRARVESVEAESQTRLDLLRKQEAAAAEWRERYLRAEEESRTRLEVARRWEAEAEKWKAQVERVEAESQTRLDLLRQREAAAEWKAQYERADADGKQRLELFRKQEAAAAEWRERYLKAEEESRTRLEVARRWEAEADQWKARAATVEDESLKQLDRSRRQDAEAQKLREEIDHWKNEGLWARLLRTLRSGGSRSAQ